MSIPEVVTLSSFLSEIKVYILVQFSRCYPDAPEKNDVRKLIQHLKQDNAGRLLLETGLKVSPSVLDAALIGLHELFIIESHSIAFESKNALEEHVRAIISLILPSDPDFSAHISFLWNNISGDLVFPSMRATRLTISQTFLLRARSEKEITIGKLANLLPYLFKVDANNICIIDANSLHLTVTDISAIARLKGEKSFEVGPFLVQVEAVTTKKYNSYKIGPFPAGTKILDALNNAADLISLPVGYIDNVQTIKARGGEFSVIFEMFSKAEDQLSQLLAILDNPPVEKMSGNDMFLYMENMKHELSLNQIHTALETSLGISVSSLKKYYWGYNFSASAGSGTLMQSPSVQLLVFGIPSVIIREVICRILLERIPAYLNKKDILMQHIKNNLHVYPIFLFIMTEGTAIVHLTDENTAIQLEKEGLSSKETLKEKPSILPEPTPESKISRNNCITKPKFDKNLEQNAEMEKGTKIVPLFKKTLPPMAHVDPMNCEYPILVQNHTLVTFGEVAACIGRRLSVRVGKITKSPFVPGYIVVPLPNERYQKAALALDQIELPSNIVLNIRKCRGSSEYPYPSLAFLRAYHQKELETFKTMGITFKGLEDESECLLIETPDEKACIKVRVELEKFLETMNSRTYVKFAFDSLHKNLIAKVIKWFKCSGNASVRFLNRNIYIFGPTPKDVEDTLLCVMNTIKMCKEEKTLSVEEATQILILLPMLREQFENLSVEVEVGYDEKGAVMITLAALDASLLIKARELVTGHLQHATSTFHLTKYSPLVEYVLPRLKNHLHEFAKQIDIITCPDKMVISGPPSQIGEAIQIVLNDFDATLFFSCTAKLDMRIFTLSKLFLPHFFKDIFEKWGVRGYSLENEKTTWPELSEICSLEKQCGFNENKAKEFTLSPTLPTIIRDGNIKLFNMSVQLPALHSSQFAGVSKISQHIPETCYNLATIFHVVEKNCPQLTCLYAGGNLFTEGQFIALCNEIAKKPNLSVYDINCMGIDGVQYPGRVEALIKSIREFTGAIYCTTGKPEKTIEFCFFGKDMAQLTNMHNAAKEKCLLGTTCMTLSLEKMGFALPHVGKTTLYPELYAQFKETAQALEIANKHAFTIDFERLPLDSPPYSFTICGFGDWILHQETVIRYLSSLIVTKIFSETDFPDLRLSYLCYKRRVEVNNLKSHFQLKVCELQKTSADDGNVIGLTLTGSFKPICNVIRAVTEMMTPLSECSVLIPFTRPTWELLRLRQQEHNKHPNISINLLPDRGTETICITLVDNKNNAGEAESLLAKLQQIIVIPLEIDPAYMDKLVKKIGENKHTFTRGYSVIVCCDNKEFIVYIASEVLANINSAVEHVKSLLQELTHANTAKVNCNPM